MGPRAGPLPSRAAPSGERSRWARPGRAPSSSWRRPRAAVEVTPIVTCQGALLLKDPTLREKRRGVQSGAGTGKKEDPGRGRRAQRPGRVRKQMDLCFKHLTSIRRESQVHTQLRRGRTPCRRRKPARKTRPRSPESQPERCARRAPKASLLLTN